MSLSPAAQDLQRTIDGFAVRRPDVIAVVVGSTDGLLITASEGCNPDHADELAAVSCGVVSIVSGSTARMFDDDQVELAIARLTHRVLMVKPVENVAVLAVLVTAEADLDNAGGSIGELARRIGRMLTPELQAELQRSTPL